MKKTKNLYAVIAFVIVLLSAAAFFYSLKFGSAVVVSRSSLSMNIQIKLTVAGQGEKKLNETLDKAFLILDNINEDMSMYNKNSSLSKINDSAGLSPVSVSLDLYYVIKRAEESSVLSDYSFNPLVGPLTRLWKINQQSKDEFTLPSQASLDEIIPLAKMENLVLTEPDTVYLKQKGCTIDLGGIVKGYAAERIADCFAAEQVKSALVDLGGCIYVLGTQPDGQSWNIGIRDPLNTQASPVAVIAAIDTSVITSGSYERFKMIDGKRYSHLFDPSTGYPIDNGMLSATVVTPDGSLADALATAFMVMGVDKALDILKGLPDVGAVMIYNTKAKGGDGGLNTGEFNIIATSNLKDKLRPLAFKGSIQFTDF